MRSSEKKKKKVLTLEAHLRTACRPRHCKRLETLQKTQDASATVKRVRLALMFSKTMEKQQRGMQKYVLWEWPLTPLPATLVYPGRVPSYCRPGSVLLNFIRY